MAGSLQHAQGHAAEVDDVAVLQHADAPGRAGPPPRQIAARGEVVRKIHLPHAGALLGVKQFPIEGGRYLVFLFTADEFSGELRGSEEGEVEWVERGRIASLPTVDDFPELLRVFDDDALTEFQYLVEGDRWDVVLR